METGNLLQKVGDKNRYQIYSIVFVCLKWLVVSLTVFLPSYLFITPTFVCGTQEKVLEADACSRIEKCQIDNLYTITAHAGLYCNNKYLRDSIISSEFIGSVVGLVILSILADRLGRKIIITSTLFLTAIGSSVLTIGAHYQIFPFLYIGLILMGFGGYSLSMVAYSYLSQINNDVWRQKSLVLTYCFWALGEIMLYPIITWIKSWIYICFFVFMVPLLILLVMSLFITQTPEFLYVQKRYDECLISLNYIAKFNKKPQLSSLGDLRQKVQQEAEQIKDTFLKKKFVIPLIVLSVAQACNNGFYYTTQYSINNFGKSFQLNMLFIGIVELGACLVTNFFCQKMYRKRWIIIFMVISGTIGLIIELTTSDSVIQLILIVLSRFLNTFCFALFSLITTQSFPTSIRSTGTGISQAMSNLGNMLSPFLVTIANQLNLKGIFIGGIICIVGGITMLLVKETKQIKKLNPLMSQQDDIDQQEEQTKKQETN